MKRDKGPPNLFFSLLNGYAKTLGIDVKEKEQYLIFKCCRIKWQPAVTPIGLGMAVLKPQV